MLPLSRSAQTSVKGRKSFRTKPSLLESRCRKSQAISKSTSTARELKVGCRSVSNIGIGGRRIHAHFNDSMVSRIAVRKRCFDADFPLSTLDCNLSMSKHGLSACGFIGDVNIDVVFAVRNTAGDCDGGFNGALFARNGVCNRWFGDIDLLC